LLRLVHEEYQQHHGKDVNEQAKRSFLRVVVGVPVISLQTPPQISDEEKGSGLFVSLVG